MRKPRVFISKQVYDICFRTEDGLPLIAAPFMEVILKGIFAAAMSIYSTRVVSAVVMGNHLHLEIIVVDPAEVPDFIGYIKRESSHAINNLLGRKRHTVWESGYSATLILDSDKMIERLAYLYLNPARANLVDSIDEYPGFTTWRKGQLEPFTLRAKRIPRESIPMIPEEGLDETAATKLAEELLEGANEEYSVEIDPLGWMECFPETANMDRAEMSRRIQEVVYREEARIRASRTHPVIGADALRAQNIRKEHSPKKFGTQVLCMGSCIERVRAALSWFKEIFAERLKLKELYSWPELMRRLPAGFFAPGRYCRASINPACLPF